MKHSREVAPLVLPGRQVQLQHTHGQHVLDNVLQTIHMPIAMNPLNARTAATSERSVTR
ncbi:MAG: hypothetical protein ACREJN_02445 [Nitrospiraceae bacterium]